MLKRDAGYYVHYFLPSIMVVITSWFGFVINISNATARVTFSIGTFYTITHLTQTFNSGLLKLSYIKSIDIWMFVCNIFVFATIMEYCIAQV